MLSATLTLGGQEQANAQRRRHANGHAEKHHADGSYLTLQRERKSFSNPASREADGSGGEESKRAAGVCSMQSKWKKRERNGEDHTGE